MFANVGPVDGLGVVIGNACFLGGPGNGEGLLVNESHQLAPLSVCDLHVLSNHLTFSVSQWQFKI